jgi:predicted nucleic acid-binding protein
VLYPAHLRDSLLLIAESGFFRPLWSAEIISELKRNLVDQVVTATQFEHLASRLNEAFSDAQVADYESLMFDLDCDVKDRHVLAAAIRGGASALVTFNISDFPETCTNKFDIAVYSPYEFLMSLLSQHPEDMFAIVDGQGQRNLVAPETLSEITMALARAGAPKFAEAILQLREIRE